MKILITGAKGFIGKNLIAELKNRNCHEILEYDHDTELSLLDEYVQECDFIFHLAGVNRPQNQNEYEGNYDFTKKLIDLLKKYNRNAPIMMSSSIQAELDNPYGNSKRISEEMLFTYQKETGNNVLIYRFPNVFGKWCRPNYNSAVATFCHNIANDLPIFVNDPCVVLTLVYIDDVVDELISILHGNENRCDRFCEVSVKYEVRLGDIVEMIQSFKKSRHTLAIPNMHNLFEKKLYSTYLSYVPSDKFSYPLKMNIDDRGSFTEFIRTDDYGQFSVNIIKPKIIKGNHWHHTKTEKFLVVFGNCVIRFRKIDTDDIINYYVSGEKLEVIDIPPGYTHNIENIGLFDSVVFMWANEAYNPDKPDTFYQEV